ncbi:hypothetical protein GCM10017562_10670 [Streptomyces roseofulvus]|uniref:Integral membrane protein n=2 Tax=Streptomyces TaxID=1883 RepID=A0ABU4K516_9ACTN|nr:hypothetical protein [Streptomyces roseolus]MDX2292846.1 hypothetical protein [Streptomyces roseolus]
MDRYVVPGAFALLLAVGGIATLRTGWVPPWLRRKVRKVALYGWAQVVMAGSFALQSAGGLAGEPAAGSAVGLVAVLTMLAALVLLLVSRLAPRGE